MQNIGPSQPQGLVGRGQGRVFTINPQDVQASNTAVAGTLFIDKIKARVLFDSGATHSFISPYFANKLARDKILMKNYLAISTPLGETIEVKYMYPACVVEVEGRVLPADLIELAVLDFDVILGMDWLFDNYATLNCREKCVQFLKEEGEEFTLQCDRSEVPANLVSMIKARKLLGKGCQGYLAYVINKETEPDEFQQIPVVREFGDVFPKELLGLPPEREIEFSVELLPGTNPISIAPYRMAPTELK